MLPLGPWVLRCVPRGAASAVPGAARAVGAQTPSLPAAGEGAAGQGGADADQTPLP